MDILSTLKVQVQERNKIPELTFINSKFALFNKIDQNVKVQERKEDKIFRDMKFYSRKMKIIIQFIPA